MEIYDLTKIQFKVLKAAVEGDAPVFLPELDPRGTVEERIDQQSELDMLNDLITLGLMEDVSKTQQTAIDLFRKQYGYGLFFYKATEHGKAMFSKQYLIVN